jgi:hypothetical protein
MGSQQSSLVDSVNISFNGTRQRLYSISTGRTSVKYQQRFDDNLSTTSTNLSTVSLSTNICQSRFSFRLY